MHGAFFLYIRHLATGDVYYYKTYSPDGKLTSGKTTGCRSKGAARAYCEKLLKEGLLYKGINQSFSQYASHFFDEGSIWMQDRMACGTPDHPAISKSYKDILRGHVSNHLVPFFQDMKMEKITPSEVKKLRLFLIEEKHLSAKSINGVVSTLRIIFQTALADGVIMLDPLRGIKPLVENKKARDAFTVEQAVEIYRQKWNMAECKDINLLSSLTGMRVSECLAVRKENLHENYIDLKDQWYEGQLTPLKTKEARKVPICKELYEILFAYTEKNISGWAFANLNPNRPNIDLKNICRSIGIDVTNLTFHSWRHFANTYYLGKDINPMKVASILGHSTGVTSMQERYLNFHIEDYEEFYRLQSELFMMLHS